MKTTYIIAGVVLALMALRANANNKPQAVIGSLKEEGIVDGTNWTTDLWATLQHAADFIDPRSPNIGGAANADPASVGTAQIGLTPGWDGSL